MKVIFVSAEASPFIKTRGLADFSSQLPSEIKKKGMDIKVLLPLHRGIKEKYIKDLDFVKSYSVSLSNRYRYVGIFRYELDGVEYYFFDNEDYFNRNRIYGEFDDGERYIFFDKAVVSFLKEMNMKADILHLNDWHCGLIPILIKEMRKKDNFYKSIKTLYTVHNLKYQGAFPLQNLAEISGISIDHLTDENFKFYSVINMLKIGIKYADTLNIVSETYKEEIKNSLYGEKLEDIFLKKEKTTYGILSGIDYKEYNPEFDEDIKYNYDKDSITVKRANKAYIEKYYGLKDDVDIPVFSMITKIEKRNGANLLIDIADELMKYNVNVIVMGSGNGEFENAFLELQETYPEKFSARMYYNQKEAKMIYAASDVIMKPSLIEPCGTSQMIGMRYGCLPIARETGGLKDSITGYDGKNADSADGFTFKNYSKDDFLESCKKALNIYYNQPKLWLKLAQNACSRDFSFSVCADKYIGLYNKILEGRDGEKNTEK